MFVHRWNDVHFTLMRFQLASSRKGFWDLSPEKMVFFELFFWAEKAQQFVLKETGSPSLPPPPLKKMPEFFQTVQSMDISAPPKCWVTGIENNKQVLNHFIALFLARASHNKPFWRVWQFEGRPSPPGHLPFDVENVTNAPRWGF